VTLAKETLIELRNNLSELERLSYALEKFGEEHHLPLKTTMDVNLALDEIFTNIVSYGFKDQGKHLIFIHLIIKEKELNITVEDDGIPFNPLEIPEPDLNLPLEERSIGGLGIHFVRNMIEELRYERKAGKNVLFLKKKFK
jgi:serine/threonine-protein kinase RsbW